ncbi:MAG: hypothetical protein QOG15_3651 [Solirubrobacteraceae bacterium]|nr:hypothetical protein [Solirubrobacteraceae bacterium]
MHDENPPADEAPNDVADAPAEEIDPTEAAKADILAALSAPPAEEAPAEEPPAEEPPAEEQ